MVLKTLAFDVGTYTYVRRYYETNLKLTQVEIWILLISALKVTAMLPDYFLQEVNYLYVIFFCNSVTTCWLGYVLHMRCQIIKDVPVEKARRFTILFVCKLTLLVAIFFCSPLFEYLLHKDRQRY